MTVPRPLLERLDGAVLIAQATGDQHHLAELIQEAARELRQGEHDEYAAIRLRGICDDLGLGHAIPEDNARLMAVQFSVFGMVRSAIRRLRAT